MLADSVLLRKPALRLYLTVDRDCEFTNLKVACLSGFFRAGRHQRPLKPGNDQKKSQRRERSECRRSLASAKPGESACFRTEASRQDFERAKLWLGNDKVKSYNFGRWFFFRELPAIERPMIKMVSFDGWASPEPDAFGNVANTPLLTALPPAKAPLRR